MDYQELCNAKGWFDAEAELIHSIFADKDTDFDIWRFLWDSYDEPTG